MDLSNSVRDKGLKSFFVGDVSKDCHGICPKGGAVGWKVQFVHNHQVETCRNYSGLEF